MGKPCAAGRVGRECLHLLNPMLCSGLFQSCVQRPKLQHLAHGPDLTLMLHATHPHPCTRGSREHTNLLAACALLPLRATSVPRRVSLPYRACPERLCAHADAPPVPLSLFILLSFIPSVRVSPHPSALVSLSRARIVPCVVFVSLECLSAVKSGACTPGVGISSCCHKPYYRTGSVRFCRPSFFPPLLPAFPSLSR